MAILIQTEPHPDLALPTTFLSDREAQIIEKALRARGPAASVHGFRSGGGLRVLYFQKRERADDEGVPYKHNPQFYGEAIQVKEAWRILADDVAAGGRPYKDVYGKTEPHYLTGTHDVSCGLDKYVLRGASFDVWCTKRSVFCRIETYSDERAPQEMTDRAAAGETGLTWTDSRGFTYLFVPQTLGNSKGCAIHTVEWPEGRTKEDAHYSFWPCYRAGGASDAPGGNHIGLAIARAVVAEEVERRR